MKRDSLLMWAAIAFFFGCMLMVAGADLWNRYKFGQSYNNALGVHFPAGSIIVIGGAFAAFGLIGMVKALTLPKT